MEDVNLLHVYSRENRGNENLIPSRMFAVYIYNNI